MLSANGSRKIIHSYSYQLYHKKTLRQSVSVHNGCRGIVVHIFIIPQKKPQQNAEASTTTAMVSLLQCEGR